MSAVSKMSLMPNGTPPSSAFLPALSNARARGQRRLAGEMGPGAHHRLALGDPLEAARDDRLGGQLAALDQPHDLGRGKAMRFDIRHGGIPRGIPPIYAYPPAPRIAKLTRGRFSSCVSPPAAATSSTALRSKLAKTRRRAGGLEGDDPVGKIAARRQHCRSRPRYAARSTRTQGRSKIAANLTTSPAARYIRA